MKKHYLTNPLKRSIIILFVLFSFILVSAQDFKNQRIVSCSAGNNHTLAIDESGNLWSWGDNSTGQLGDGTLISKSSPTLIKKGTKFKVVSAGDFHSMAIDESGYLWAWGYSYLSRLGGGDYLPLYVKWPLKIENKRKFKTVSAGYSHTLAIDELGNLWAWGDNDCGQIGNGKRGLDEPDPVLIKYDIKFRDVSAGGDHSLAIDVSGYLWAWGDNGDGQLGDGTWTSKLSPTLIKSGTKFKAISAGYINWGSHSFAIDEKGNMWAWGYNYDGRLGEGTISNKYSPVQIKSGTKFTAISTKAKHSSAIDESGKMWLWGQNRFGQLGNGETSNKLYPNLIEFDKKIVMISTGEYHSMAIDEIGNLRLWGHNNQGQLGHGIDSEKLLPVPIKTDTKFQSISAGCNFSMAIDESANLLVWGLNDSGQLGDNSNAGKRLPEQIKTISKFKSVSAGNSHALTIDLSGNLWACGDNIYAQLGDGTRFSTSTPVQIKTGTIFKFISAGNNRSRAIDEYNMVWQWGEKFDGFDTFDLSPISIHSKCIMVATQGDNSHIIDESGNLWGWGSNYWGELGNGSTTKELYPIKIKSDTKFQTVSTGYQHTLAIDSLGYLWAWGHNYNGQLGDGTSFDRYLPVQIKSDTRFHILSAGSDFSLAIDTSGNLWSWGHNEYGQLGDGTTIDKKSPVLIKSGTKFQSVSAGSNHSLAIDESGFLWVWGHNYSGQLGDGTAWNEKPIWLNVGNISVEGVNISYANLTINKDSTFKLTATIMPIDAANKTVKWSCSNESIAIIDSTGLLTGLALGTTTVTATTSDGGKTSSCIVTVISPVLSLNLSSETATIRKDSTIQLTASITPSDATNDTCIWSSSDKTIATVNSTGLVTGIAPGSTIISVTTADGGKTDSCVVTVIIPVLNLSISNNILTIKKDSTFQLEAAIIPSDATNNTCIWSSSDTIVASVDSLGLVTGIRSGLTTIYATSVDGAIKDSCIVTVISPVSGLILSKESISLRRDSTFQLTATVLPPDATNDTIIWTSSDESVATVDSTGLVIGVGKGIATITATTVDGGKTATCEVTVLPGLSVMLSDNGTPLMVYPNPLKDGQLNIRLNGQTNDADLTIFNAIGQLVYSGIIRTKETIQIEYKTFKPGLHLIKVSSDEMNEVRKILVERN